MNDVAINIERWKPLSTVRSDRRGSITIMAAILGIALIGTAALAVDVGAWELNKSAMQGAADQAALAAGFAGLVAGPAEAKGVAAAYGFVDGKGGVSVAINTPPTQGSYTNSATAIQVVISQSQPQYLSSVLLKSQPTASARAVAVSPRSPACIVALATSGTGIGGNGSGTFGGDTCNIYVNSPSSCAISVNGTSVRGNDIFLAGPAGSVCHNGGTVTAADKIAYKTTAVQDPYLSRTIPVPNSKCINPPILPVMALVAGTYCGFTILGGAIVNLGPGLYIFDGAKGGNLSVNGSITLNGTDVTLVFTSSTSAPPGGISVNGSADFNLSATPNTGSTNIQGIALWFGGTSGLNINGSDNLAIVGAVYAPNAAITWNGSTTTRCTQLVANSISFNGSATFQQNCGGLGVGDIGSTGSYKVME